MVAAGEDIARPSAMSGETSEAADDRRERVLALKAALAGDVPRERSERTEEQHARWLLAEMLEWHRRESKAVWWEYFRLHDLPPEELLTERAAIAGLEFCETVGGTAKCPIDRYRYPHQDAELRSGADLHTADGAFGVIDRNDQPAGIVDIKKRGSAKDLHPPAVFECTIVRADVLSDSLFRPAEWIAEHGVEGDGLYRAARDLLRGQAPRLSGRAELNQEAEDPLAAARRLATALDSTVLPIQGPPGAGKTYAAARMILELVKGNKKVGVTAVSHKVIRNLLDEVVRAADQEGQNVLCAQKVGEESPTACPEILELKDNAGLLACISDGTTRVVGGNAWVWARPDFFEAVDVLFVDEAGQMSLANVLAVAQAARSVVLLGDPRQLEQPQKGSHPEGIEVSALEHLLGAHRTIPQDRGLFLDKTWRLHLARCG